MSAENNVAAQAGDETAALAKQLREWRAEVARLNDLIAHASDVQAGDEPMRGTPSLKPSEWSADTPLNAIIDGDAIAKAVRIMCLIDNYTEAMESPINQHARHARTAIRCALVAEFEAVQVSPPATADVGRDAGIEAAAALIDRKVNAYDDDMGSTDRETGTREYPGDGGEWVNEMGELAEEIRALKSVATTKPGA